MSVKRVFVEKKPEFAVQARELCDEIEESRLKSSGSFFSPYRSFP